MTLKRNQQSQQEQILMKNQLLSLYVGVSVCVCVCVCVCMCVCVIVTSFHILLQSEQLLFCIQNSTSRRSRNRAQGLSMHLVLVFKMFVKVETNQCKNIYKQKSPSKYNIYDSISYILFSCQSIWSQSKGHLQL